MERLCGAMLRTGAGFARSWPRTMSHTALTAPQVGVAGVIFPVAPDGLIDVTRVLLVQRGRPPSKGLWCFPGGRLELGESMAQGAHRELLEETGVHTLIPTRPLAALAAHDALDRDAAGTLRFHYCVAHVLGFAAADAHPVAADDALAAAWVRTGLQQSDTQPRLPSAQLQALQAHPSAQRAAPTAELPQTVDELAAAGQLIPEVADVLQVAALWLRHGLTNLAIKR